MTAQVIQFPGLPHPIDGGHCQVTACGAVIDYPFIMCTEHMSMVPRPVMCRIRQAWRQGSTDRWGQACIDAVHAVEDQLDRLALARGGL